ncbi:MAG: High-affinity zinc uptake system ATP-binding protein ZnuC [Eubacteriales bacterium SKADARSKE-1]|nr:High-affinity zinc uptake system ATP-binding protein ZnuC [Eubacteriales bacterium SKADARSKE-1]
MNLIEIKNLDVLYKTGYRGISALKNVNANIKSGEYVCIIGNNGTGKSSLIKSILGLVSVSSGNIKLKCNKNEISYIPQFNTIPLDFPATVHELVLSGTQKSNMGLPFYTKEDKASTEKAVRETGLKGLEKRRFCELSGGQQQRVLLARALCKKPRILILDEPCSGLDEKTTADFYELLLHLNTQHGTTIIMISHDLINVEKYATRIIKLDKAILFDGSVSEWIKKRNDGEPI